MVISRSCILLVLDNYDLLPILRIRTNSLKFLLACLYSLKLLLQLQSYDSGFVSELKLFYAFIHAVIHI